MADLGSDFAGVLDFDPAMPIVSGALCLAQALARRLTTRPGTLLDDPDYGFDLRMQLNTAFNASFIERRVADECLKDERVADADVTAVYDTTSQTATLTILLTGEEDEEFTLTLLASALTVELLDLVS